MTDAFELCEGGCTCGHVRFRVTSDPLIVHACHCRWCQRQSGTAFATNALIETERVELIQGDVEELMIDSPSGKGQLMARCPKCRVTLWTHYYFGGLRDYIRFFKVGTLDDPDRYPPNVHIFTSTMQPWVIIPKHHKRVDNYYDNKDTWSKDSLTRLDAIVEAAKANKDND
ncbi:MAG: GFA family protein [Paracoccaceae bacterium]|nr:GFA family protein [Paracoccaceae bacterium]MDG1736787.1 GFA family protein [Paracoccaceae bacterium]MDG2258336.1 GFA family protein [Paracoccaceae bacterium]